MPAGNLFPGSTTSPALAGWMDLMGAKRPVCRVVGPAAVITDLAIMRFDEETRRMYLAGIYPGVDTDRILDNMGFEVDMSRVETVPPPSPEELVILREQCDPQRLILGN